MNKLLLAIAATTASFLALFPVKYVQAASLGLTVTENLTDDTTPIPGIPNFYLFKNLVSAEGQITSIDGFSSLQGVNPSSLTLNFGNVELLSYTNQGGIVYTTFGNDGLKTPFFNLLENGQVIATSNDIQVSSISNALAGSPDYGKATSDVKIALNGVSGNPFFQEIQQLTNGTGILDINLETPTGIIPVYTISTDTPGVFTYTGGTLIASTPNQTNVPEPSVIGGLLVLGTGLLLRRRLNLHPLKKYKTN